MLLAWVLPRKHALCWSRGVYVRLCIFDYVPTKDEISRGDLTLSCNEKYEGDKYEDEHYRLVQLRRC